MPALKPFHSTGIHHELWTPYGPRSLAELPFDGRQWHPCLLGTFNVDVWERPFSNEAEDRPSASAEQRSRLLHINEDFTGMCDSSHDYNPVLG